MRIVITLRSDANANVVLNKLYKMTAMQSSFSVNNVPRKRTPPHSTSKRYCQAFNDHRREVVTRRTEFQLRKRRPRARTSSKV